MPTLINTFPSPLLAERRIRVGTKLSGSHKHPPHSPHPSPQNQQDVKCSPVYERGDVPCSLIQATVRLEDDVSRPFTAKQGPLASSLALLLWCSCTWVHIRIILTVVDTLYCPSYSVLCVTGKLIIRGGTSIIVLRRYSSCERARRSVSFRCLSASLVRRCSSVSNSYTDLSRALLIAFSRCRRFGHDLTLLMRWADAEELRNIVRLAHTVSLLEVRRTCRFIKVCVGDSVVVWSNTMRLAFCGSRVVIIPGQ